MESQGCRGLKWTRPGWWGRDMISDHSHPRPDNWRYCHTGRKAHGANRTPIDASRNETRLTPCLALSAALDCNGPEGSPAPAQGGGAEAALAGLLPPLWPIDRIRTARAAVLSRLPIPRARGVSPPGVRSAIWLEGTSVASQPHHRRTQRLGPTPPSRRGQRVTGV